MFVQAFIQAKAAFRTYFFTGLIVLVPLAITLWVISWVIGTMDLTLKLLPIEWQPARLLGIQLPGLGALLTFIFIFIVGLLTQNFIGRRLLTAWNRLLRYIPIVGPLYTSVKQVSDTLLATNSHAFRQALLIEYPRQGVYTIALVTGLPANEIKKQLKDDYVSVYLPTSPNPTSGLVLIVRRSETIELNMSVEAALRYIVSMGVVHPDLNNVLDSQFVDTTQAISKKQNNL